MIELLENLYRQHRQGLFTLALSIVRSPDLAEDAIQNAFTKLFHRVGVDSELPTKKNMANREFENRDCETRDWTAQEAALKNGNAVAYVFRAVRNSAIDLHRADTRKRNLGESLFAEFRSGDAVDGPPERLLTKERDELLKQAIDKLPEKDREAVILKLFAGLTFEQAGQVAVASPKTIASRYRRALEKLENQLKGQI
jgi:RNA polymerase sigma-70 factor (ECF subfamily)